MIDHSPSDRGARRGVLALVRRFLPAVMVAALTVTACGGDGESRPNGAEAPEAAPNTAPAAQPEPQRVTPQSREEIQLSFAPVAQKVAPAVVNIYTRKVVKQQGVPQSPFFNDPFFRRFFGDSFGPAIPRERVQNSLGSGVIVREDGVIVTNNHVIGGADEITVALSDRREFEAKVIMTDESTDLAVLQIDAPDEKLPYLELRDSDQLQVGDLVLAIGNPFGVGQTVTSGIVSAVARTNVGVADYQFFIQTDAAINPGNSGGALVTLDGRLVGVNTAIFSSSGGYMGIGFAIPSNMVGAVVSAALSDGEVVRPWIGASGQPVTSDVARSLGLDRPIGVLIDQIYKGGPADKAGIRVGDIVTHVGGFETSTPDALRFRLRVSEKNDKGRIPVRILRKGKEMTVELEVRPAPEDPPRDITILEGEHFLHGVEVGNLSPAFAEELKLDPMQRGVIVLGLRGDSPARRYRLLRPGDILLGVNGERINVVGDVAKALKKDPASFRYRIQRGDRVIDCARVANRFQCRE